MKIKIHKFKTLQDREVAIPTEILGGNGTGKTTILEAISFVLTGKDLNGSEFRQVYDNRVDLHDAIADVSYFDNYGNEFRRTVEPTFATSRAGEEYIKILRGTRCTKNSIDVTDFSGEFTEFYKFGTDYFFNQNESDQRSIFIDLMKSLLPDYDVQNAQLKLKSLKKTQRETVQEIDLLRKELKGIQDVEVIEIPEDLQELEEIYQDLVYASSDNQALIAQVNASNNTKSNLYRTEKNRLESLLDDSVRKVKGLTFEIERLGKELEGVKETQLTGFEPTPTTELEQRLEAKNREIETLSYFGDLKDYARIYAMKNPVVVENMQRISRLKDATPDNLPDGEQITDICFNCGQSSQSILDKGIENIVSSLKAENKQVLEREMREANANYLTIKDERDRILAQINRIEAENKRNLDNFETTKRGFDIKKTNEIVRLSDLIKQNNASIKKLEEDIKILASKLDSLEEPELDKLPTEMTILQEIKDAHLDFVSLRDKKIGQIAVNKNNTKNKAKKEQEVKDKRALLIDIDTQISSLQAEITEYFSSLTEVVKNEFKGAIEIGVQLQEYIITRDEYKDIFRITADGKVFPFECNGALQNNTKLQVLGTLQRLKGYRGITIMDNAEANTTQPILSGGLNLVLAKATNEKELIIK